MKLELAVKISAIKVVRSKLGVIPNVYPTSSERVSTTSVLCAAQAL